MKSVFKAVLTFSIILLVLTDLISSICMIDNLNDLRIYINKIILVMIVLVLQNPRWAWFLR